MTLFVSKMTNCRDLRRIRRLLRKPRNGLERPRWSKDVCQNNFVSNLS